MYALSISTVTAIALACYRYGRWRRIRLTAERRRESLVSAEILVEEGQS